MFETSQENLFHKKHKGIVQARRKLRGNLLIYGMGPGKLADSLSISIGEAKRLMRKYFDTFPTIKDLLDKLEKEAMENKYAYSPLDGRKRIFSGIDWDHGGKVAHMKNIAKNQPFQGAGASVTKLALCRMKKAIDAHNWDAKLILTVHDKFCCGKTTLIAGNSC